MKATNQVITGLSIIRTITVCLMVFCLSVLTCVNYFLYPATNTEVVSAHADRDSDDREASFPPTGIPEEKSTTTGFSVAEEEILHHAHPDISFKSINLLYAHHIAEADKIELFHPELILPPPKFRS